MMGADQIAEISPMIHEVQAAYAELPEESDLELCATLELDGRPEAWLQFIYCTLNFAYPRHESPEELLADVLDALPGWRLESALFARRLRDQWQIPGYFTHALPPQQQAS
ncbi:hypothetical protein [Duganella sp. Root1480D1]|uniref:hypothetical protein n=1 Tax=Duganella sp. Root1480D1 TaxID=1736471 RepID=UPI0012E35182|nr:hypothetical protein [Duganella sp. Root1480D1]